MKHLQLLLVFIAILPASITSLHAQVTTATLTGLIVDDEGNPLDAATVVAIHLPSGTQYGTTTREDGRFTLPNLRVGGPYTVEANYLGYDPGKVEGIFLSLAQKLTVDLDLKSSALELEEVVVQANADPLLNSDRTGAATNITSDQLRRLPTISRSAADYYRLTPSSDGNSFAGRNDQFNNFSLNGSIFNNPFGLDAATPGGQTDAQPISLDAIDQITVSVAPYDVTQAGFTGASIDAVTKSGTNDFSGTVFGFYRNQDMTGSKVSGTDIVVPELRQFQAGFSLGGPIIRNKLFFFVNAEVERREDQGSNFVAARPGIGGENVSRVEAQDLELVSNTLRDAFGYETGPYEGYIHNTDNEKGIVKLDWVINNQHSLTATYNFLNASKEKPAHPSALGRRGPDATTLQFFNSGYQINNVIHSGIVELRSIFGNWGANKLQAGYTAFRDSRDPLSAPFPVLNINRDGIRYIVAGHEPFSIHNRLDQDVYQVTNNFNLYLGNHTLTIGSSLERFNFDNSFNLGVYEPFGVPYDGGTFGPGFASVQDFVSFVNAGGMNPVVDHARNLFETNNMQVTEGVPGYEGTGWALAETNVGQWGVYLQDEILVGNDFKLTLGLRMDMPLYFDTDKKIQENINRKGGVYDAVDNPGAGYNPAITWYDTDGNPVMFDHTQLPDNTPLFSPRLGFNWDVLGNRSLQLRGGSGLFSGRFPFVWIGNQVANPDWFFYTMTSPDFQFPQVWRSNLGIDKRFGNSWIISGDLIYTQDINGMMVRNYGLRPPTDRLGSVDDRPVYDNAQKAMHEVAPGFFIPVNGYVFTNTDVGYSLNATVQIQKTFRNGYYASLAYNYLDAKDASSIEAEISGDAYDRNPAINHVNIPRETPSLYGNRHRFVGSANKRFEYGGGTWATTVALFFEYARGGRFTYTYSGDINNDGSGLNDLIYIPTESDLQQMQFSGATQAEQDAQRNALAAFIAQDDYLSSNRGAYAEKYDILSPWYSRWDLRVLQDLNLKVGQRTHTVQLSLDMLNVGNFISSDWGVRQLPTNTQPIGVTVDDSKIPTYSFDPTLVSTFTDDFSLLSRWQLQAGLRYIF
ncbi:MAG: carboxypeptidase regulatory-like domain-containing protein [Phaeodactylibacter sp.]|nr:carboxypeptidase regulatory-like domain-containing protein [Phaeodactylibacter sp.]